MAKNKNRSDQSTPAPFSIRFTKEERKILERAAGNRTLGAYIRWLLFKDDIPPSRTRSKKPVKDHKELAKVLALFGQSRIANNINQLAKAVNTGSLPVNADVHKALIEAARSVGFIRQTLLQALGLREGVADDPESQ